LIQQNYLFYLWTISRAIIKKTYKQNIISHKAANLEMATLINPLTFNGDLCGLARHMPNEILTLYH